MRSVGEIKWRLNRYFMERAALKKIKTASSWLSDSMQNHVEYVRQHRDPFFKKSFLSQNGEDGVLAALVDLLDLKLIGGSLEFGFSIFENNTLALSLKHGNRAIFLDGSTREVDRANEVTSALGVRNVRSQRAFMTRENINQIIAEASGNDPSFDVISIDVDGNDYWLWEALTIPPPSIVVIEYNASFGKTRSVTVPYRPDFNRMAAHPSGLFHGASLRALCQLGTKKGYELYGTDAEGLNAYFVRESLQLPDVHRAVNPEAAFRSHGPRIRRGLSQGQQEEIVLALDLVDIPTDT